MDDWLKATEKKINYAWLHEIGVTFMLWRILPRTKRLSPVAACHINQRRRKIAFSPFQLWKYRVSSIAWSDFIKTVFSSKACTHRSIKAKSYPRSSQPEALMNLSFIWNCMQGQLVRVRPDHKHCLPGTSRDGENQPQQSVAATDRVVVHFSLIVEPKSDTP